jgi:hypothetical protein
MIPPRIAEHVKVHDWFAVLIDFAIVVIRVFIGTYNWYERRNAVYDELVASSSLQREGQAMTLRRGVGQCAS